MQRRGWRVSSYARDLPPDTTSNVAAAQCGALNALFRDVLLEGGGFVVRGFADVAAVGALRDDCLYMFPRSDGILLGGTFERDVWNLEPNAAAAEGVLAGRRNFFTRMRTP